MPTMTRILLAAGLAMQVGSVAAAKDFTAEYEEALAVEPNLENGRQLYVNCISCHGANGWGKKNGTYPQIAGQLKGVIIKQLEDIRAGNRSNPLMRAFTSERILADAQDIADIAGYISQLPMSPDNGQGNPALLDKGKELYAENCTECHGENAEGDPKDQTPLMQGQHYMYLARQFNHIRLGLRRNANKKMIQQIKSFKPTQEAAVLSYTASIKPPEEKTAAANWYNPDFAYMRRR